MKSLNTYLFEKFKISNDIHSYKDLPKNEFNKKTSEVCASWAADFLPTKFDKDEYEIKINKRGEVLVYLYGYDGLDRERKKEKEAITTEFWNFYKDKNKEFEDEYGNSALSWVDVTKYGFKMTPNFAFDEEDFKHVVIKR